MENVKESAGSPTEQKQRDVVCAMARGESLESALAACQVAEEEFIDWVCGGKFPMYAASLARGFAETKAAYVWSELMKLAKEGNVSAMRLYLDVLYRKNGGRPENPSGGTGADQELAGLRESIFNGEKGGE